MLVILVSGFHSGYDTGCDFLIGHAAFADFLQFGSDSLLLSVHLIAVRSLRGDGADAVSVQTGTAAVIQSAFHVIIAGNQCNPLFTKVMMQMLDVNTIGEA